MPQRQEPLKPGQNSFIIYNSSYSQIIFLEIWHTFYTHFSMANYEAKDKEREKIGISHMWIKHLIKS